MILMDNIANQEEAVTSLLLSNGTCYVAMLSICTVDLAILWLPPLFSFPINALKLRNRVGKQETMHWMAVPNVLFKNRRVLLLRKQSVTNQMELLIDSIL